MSTCRTSEDRALLGKVLTLRRVLTEHHSGTHDDNDDDSGGGGGDDDDDDVNNNCINPALPQKYTTSRNRIVWCLLCFLEMAFVQSTNFGGHIAAFNRFNSISITAHKTRPYPAKVRAKICTRVRRPEIVEEQRTGRGCKIIVIVDVETPGGL